MFLLLLISSAASSILKQGSILDQELGEGVGRQRLAEKISLHFIALKFAQELRLLRGFHAFGNHVQAQALCLRVDGASDGGILVVRQLVFVERAVDLEAVDRKALL